MQEDQSPIDQNVERRQNDQTTELKMTEWKTV